jgi:branched-subunit amino acid transport protein
MKLLLSMGAMMGITYLIRFLPFALLKRPVNNRFIRAFLYYIPYSVLTAMTFPAIFYSTGNMAASIAGCVVAILLAFWERSLIIVAICAVAAAFFIILIF